MLAERGRAACFSSKTSMCVMGYTGRGLTWLRELLASQRALCQMELRREPCSLMPQHTQRNASWVSQMLMKSPTWTGPICAVSFTSERQEWKPLWKPENSPVVFGCHTGVSYRETISQPPPTLLSLALWLLQRVPKNPITLPVPTNLGETKL